VGVLVRVTTTWPHRRWRPRPRPRWRPSALTRSAATTRRWWSATGSRS